MNVTDVREIAYSSVIDEIAKIEDQIRREAKAGGMSMTIDKILPAVAQYLKDNGFDVDFRFSYSAGGSRYIISW